MSPLYLACRLGNTEFALNLLRAGASPDSPARRSNGRLYTPLRHAAIHPNLSDGELCRALLDAGATVGLGWSPLEWRGKIKPEILKMITGVCNHPDHLSTFLIYLDDNCFYTLSRTNRLSINHYRLDITIELGLMLIGKTLKLKQQHEIDNSAAQCKYISFLTETAMEQFLNRMSKVIVIHWLIHSLF